MKIAIAIAPILLGLAQLASADSYTIFDLGNDNGRGIHGIDGAGDVVVWGTYGCGTSFPICYMTYVNGVATGNSATAPDLAYDNGVLCNSAPAGFNISGSAVCNNGRIGLGTIYNPNVQPNGVYVGSDASLQLLRGGSVDQVFMNSLGDFAWTDGQSEEIFLAIVNSTSIFQASRAFLDPVSTPEPRSLILVGSGILLFALKWWGRRESNPLCPKTSVLQTE